MRINVDRLTLLAFGLIVIIAGTNFVAVKFSNQELAPFWGASIRFFAASFLLFLFMLIAHIPVPKGKALTGALLYGIIGFGISYALLYWALLRVQAGLASIIVALVPLITFFLTIFHGLEKFQFRIMAGGLIAASGIALIFYDQLSFVSLSPLLALVVAAICIAETGIIVKLFPKNHPVSMNAIGMFVGSLLLFLLSQATGEIETLAMQPSTLFAIIYLILIGSVVNFGLVIFVLKRWTASAVSYQLVLVPIVTMVLASVIRNEVITPVSLLGSLIVLGGVYVGALASNPGNKQS